METIDRIKSALNIGPKVKVVGQVDLDGINEATRPAKKSKEELEEQRQRNKEEQQAHNREIIVRDLTGKRERLQREICEATAMANDLRRRVGEVRSASGLDIRLRYLKEKQAVRERYADLTLSNDQRQKELALCGIRPQKMDVVHFHVPRTKEAAEMDGVALARDENHYYLAVDLFDQPEQEDNATTMMDENPDGTFDGIWPKHTVLKPAQRFEERFMRTLTDKYADDLDRSEEFVEAIREKEAEEIGAIMASLAEADKTAAEAEQALTEMTEKIKHLNAELLDTDAELRRYRQEAADAQGDAVGAAVGMPDDIEYEPVAGIELDTPAEKKYPHLPFVRGRRMMLTMNWPQIEGTYEPWLRFRLMANIARMVMMLKRSHALTYVLTEEYYEEMAKRGRDYYKTLKAEDVVAHGDIASGIVVYPSQGHQDTIMYRVDNTNLLGIIVVYLREDRLMFYESFSMQEVINRPRTDHFMCHSLRESGTSPSSLFSWIRNLVVSHLAMERDMERVVHSLVEEDKGSAMETDIREEDTVDITGDHDIVLRDAAWYTDLTVNREIPVRGYISHRWCGSGKEKFIREVWVRPHVKHGYHREAGIKK